MTEPNEPRTVAEVEGLLGAYALDAVDADERAAVEDHLAVCPRCRAELAEHLETASFLAHGGAAAPEGLWPRIASSLEESPPALRLGVVEGAGDGSRGARRRRPHARSVVWAAVAAAAVVVVAVLAVQLVRQGNQIDDLHSQMAATGVSHAAMDALADPASRKVDLRSPDGQPVSATAVISRGGTGYLLPSELPRLTADRTYQLWALMPGHAISLGLLGAHPGIVAFPGKGPITGLAITEEHAGGVVSSSNPPVLVGQI